MDRSDTPWRIEKESDTFFRCYDIRDNPVAAFPSEEVATYVVNLVNSKSSLEIVLLKE